MNDREMAALEESLIWEQGLRLFALTNLSESNPFRKEIEEQSVKSMEDLFRLRSSNHSTERGEEEQVAIG